MRIILISFLLLFVMMGHSQRNEYIQAFREHMPEGLGKEINLPDPSHGAFNIDRFNPLFGEKLIMVIVSDSMYHSIFSRYEKDSLPFIDFCQDDLVLYRACGQCLANCEHEKNGSTSCHRNVCYYQQAWFIRKKDQNLEPR